MASYPIEILADSTCDIPAELVERYQIGIIPQTVIWNNQVYRDRLDLQPAEFYERLRTDLQRPTSSLPGLPAFQEAYSRAAARGAEFILMFTVSGAMSGTYHMAVKAAKASGVHVTVIDSRGPTMSLGWQVLAAARLREAGVGVTGILEQVAAVRSKLVQFVGMETLEYLKIGGRLGGAARWAGVMLNIRPLVSINHQSGLVEPVELHRTHKGLVRALHDRFFEKVGPGKGLHVAVLHGDAEPEACELARRIQAEHAPAELLVNITGPVLGINTGPGALALCGYVE